MSEMFDSVDPAQIPAGADAAGYVDGRWQTFSVLHGPHVLSVAVFATDDAEALDVEPGDATVAQVAAWVRREQDRGVWRPCVYTSLSGVPAVLAALAAAGIARPSVRIWSAHYTYAPHICGPGCGLAGPVDATQWTDRSGGRNLDESTVSGGFWPPAPITAATFPPQELPDMTTRYTQWCATDANGCGWADFPTTGTPIACYVDAADPVDTGSYERPAATVVVGAKVPPGVVRVQVTGGRPQLRPGYTVHLTVA